MSIWLPETERFRQQAESVLDQTRSELEHFNRELKRIDPYIQLVRADPQSAHPQLRPGYYHIIQTPPGVPPTVEVWEGPNGEFREPGSDLFEYLRHTDGDSNRSRREREKRQRELKRAREREKERETEDRREELFQRLKSKSTVRIAVPK